MGRVSLFEKLEPMYLNSWSFSFDDSDTVVPPSVGADHCFALADAGGPGSVGARNLGRNYADQPLYAHHLEHHAIPYLGSSASDV